MDRRRGLWERSGLDGCHRDYFQPVCVTVRVKRHGAARAAQKPCAVTGFGSASVKSQRTAKVVLRFEKVNISSCLTVEEDRGKKRLVQL